MPRAGRTLIAAFLVAISIFMSGSSLAAATTTGPTSQVTAAPRSSGIDKVVRSNGQVKTYLNQQGTIRLALLNLTANALAEELRNSGVPFIAGAGIAPTMIRWSGLTNLDTDAIYRAYARSCRRGVMVAQGYLWGPAYVRGVPIGIGYLIVAPRDDGKRC